jgi:hypothetical protein
LARRHDSPAPVGCGAGGRRAGFRSAPASGDHGRIEAAGGNVPHRILYRASSMQVLGGVLNGQLGVVARITALRRSSPTVSPQVRATPADRRARRTTRDRVRAGGDARADPAQLDAADAVGVPASFFDAIAVLIAVVVPGQLAVGPGVRAAAAVLILGSRGVAAAAAAGVLMTVAGTVGGLCSAAWPGGDQLWVHGRRMRSRRQSGRGSS